MNYRIIQDEDALRSFIDWLPELQPGMKFYVSLLARNKYMEDRGILGTDKLALKRFTSDKAFLFRKIKQLEVAYGAYTCKDGSPLPEESLALYITPNPRSLVRASKNILKVLLDKVLVDYDGYDPQSLILSEIQKACGQSVYFDFDFDGVGIEQSLEGIKESVNLDACTFVKTRGGFHLLVKMEKIGEQYRKSWNPKISKMLGCDVRGKDGLLPVPGTVQGGFMPRMVKL